jgi:hypothetical protein
MGVERKVGRLRGRRPADLEEGLLH